MVRAAISVCMPTYNGARYIKEQLDSIVAQLEDNDEVIVVDDGSRDGTRSILEGFAQRDDRIRVIMNTKNVGVVGAVEIAVANASREIIFLSDQDDIWLAGKVERALSKLDQDGIVAVLSNSEIFVDNKSTGTLFFGSGYQPRFSIGAQLYKNDFIGCCMCFKKSILSTALPFPKRISMHDWWLGVNALAAGGVVFDEEPSILYRRHGANLSPSSRRGIASIIRSRIFDALGLFKLLRRAGTGRAR